jgi:hypothetical protein
MDAEETVGDAKGEAAFVPAVHAHPAPAAGETEKPRAATTMSRAPRRVALDLRGLAGEGDIFRLHGAEKHAAAVDSWLGEPNELRSIAALWFERMRQCGDDVRELMHDGCPVACIEDAPFGYVNSFKKHVGVGFFYGAELVDAAGLLEGSGKRMRHAKIRPGTPYNAAALRKLIEAAYLDLGKRLIR